MGVKIQPRKVTSSIFGYNKYCIKPHEQILNKHITLRISPLWKETQLKNEIQQINEF